MSIYQPTADELETFRERTQEPVGEIINSEMDDTSWIDMQEQAVQTAVEQTGYNPDLA